MIGELSNPQGIHGQEDSFLKLFLGILDFEEPEFNSKGAEVWVEKTFNVEGDEKEQINGRIDLMIRENAYDGRILVIENKIFAKDQPEQLKRYQQYALKDSNNKKENIHLFYLTLWGTGPDEFSTGDLVEDEDYKLISYENEIIQWLDLCAKEVYDKPVIRETIIQYSNLLHQMTNSTKNTKEMEEIKSKIIDSEIFIFKDQIRNVYNALNEIHIKIINNFLENLRKLNNESQTLKFKDETKENKRFNNQIRKYVSKEGEKIDITGLWVHLGDFMSNKIIFKMQLNSDLSFGYGLKILDENSHEFQEELEKHSNIEKLRTLHDKISKYFFNPKEFPFYEWIIYEESEFNFKNVTKENIKKFYDDKSNELDSEIQDFLNKIKSLVEEIKLEMKEK